MALTPKQIEAIALLIEVPEMTYDALSKHLCIGRTTLWRWRNDDEEFKEAYRNEVRRKWDEAKDIALDRMVGMARGGEFKACKYILDSSEFAPVEKKQIEANVESTNFTIVVE